MDRNVAFQPEFSACENITLQRTDLDALFGNPCQTTIDFLEGPFQFKHDPPRIVIDLSSSDVGHDLEILAEFVDDRTLYKGCLESECYSAKGH